MEYEFIGRKLTPGIAEKLTFKFYNGKQAAKSEIKPFILNYHLENGGIIDSKTANKYINDALSRLSRTGKIKEINGMLFISDKGDFSSISEAEQQPLKNITQPSLENNINIQDNTVAFNDNDKNDIAIANTNQQRTDFVESIGMANDCVVETNGEHFQIKPDRIIGEGTNAVFFYYNETEKELASLKGNDKWRYKIIHADKDSINNMMSQAIFYSSRYLHIALEIHTDNSRLLEESIHALLKFKCRNLEKHQGQGWYLLSSNDIENLCNIYSG